MSQGLAGDGTDHAVVVEPVVPLERLDRRLGVLAEVPIRALRAEAELLELLLERLDI